MKKNLFLIGRKAYGIKRLIRIMKFSLVFFIITGLNVVTATSYSQRSKLDLLVENKSLVDLFKLIEDQSDYKFFYQEKQVSGVEKQISLQVEGKSINEVLNGALDNTSLKYKIIDNHVIIYLNDGKSEKVIQQEKLTITGKVTDDNGESLPGVAILIKGTTDGTITNIDGEYSINNVNTEDVLVFSFIGMASQEISVDGRTVIDVVMQSDAIGLEEVVAVGFATQKKVNLTGAVGSLKSEALESRPVANATQMLQGLVGGLNIAQGSGGSLESRPTINVRGAGTIGVNSSGSTLILIDGMEGDINAINPQDIESVSVLKDAAASSIYGSRAPFGVILVTTKKGTAGKMKVNYNNSFRSSSPINMPEMMDSYTFATYFNDGCLNTPGWGTHFSEERLQRIKDFQEGKITDTTIPHPNNPGVWSPGYRDGNDNIDWYDALYRDNSFSQEHNLSFSGGKEDLKYYISANIFNQDGLMEFNRDEFTRYTTTVKLNVTLTDYLKANVSTRFVREDYGRPSFLNDNLFKDLARQAWPVLPLYDPNGYLFSSPSPALNLRDGGRDKSQKDWLYQQGQFVFEPIKGWKTFAELNYRTKNNFRHWDLQKTYNHDVNGNPIPVRNESEVREEGIRENYLNTNIYSEYSKQVTEAHFIKVMLGFQSEKNNTRNVIAKKNGIIVPGLPTLHTSSGNDASGSAVPPFVDGEYKTWATAGYFGRINYNFCERYLFEMNLRYDGASRFRDDKRWNFFPSASVGWNIAKEEFWESNMDVLSTFKLRVSYGELGNQNTESWYPTYMTMPFEASKGKWLVNGLKPNTSKSPKLISTFLTWETIRSYNMGLDIGALRNRLTGSLDLFKRETLNMVGPAPTLPEILGTDVPNQNNTDLKTYGFELELGWNDRLKNGLGYNVKFILSDSQTKITKYPNPTSELNEGYETDKKKKKYRTSMMLGEIWGYETIGIAKSDEEMNTHLASLPNGGQNAFGSVWEAGDIMYKDINNDGKIDAGSNTAGDSGDRKIIGNSTPRYRFSLDISADYKGFDFRAFFQGIGKRDIWQGSYYFWGVNDNIWWSAGLKPHVDYFRADADHVLGQNIDSYYPRPRFDGSNGNRKVQTRYLQNGAYIRLKNIQLGYTLPNSITEKIKLNKVRVFVSGENLWTATKMSDLFDPETAGGGWGGNVYPLSKTISAGMSVNF